MKNIKQIILVVVLVVICYFAYSYLLHNAVIDWNTLHPQYKINL